MARMVITTPDRRRPKPVEQRSLAELLSGQTDVLHGLERLAANTARGQQATAVLLDAIAEVGTALIVLARGKRG